MKIAFASIIYLVIGIVAIAAIAGIIALIVASGKKKPEPTTEEGKSYFDGGYFAYLGMNFLVFFVTLITFGIAFPWMCCVLQKWKAKHTIICGKRMYFDGTGLQLIGNYLLWMLLSFITLGIYSFWMALAIKKWITKHTHFVGEEDNNSYFDGGILGFVGTNILSSLVFFVPVVGTAWSKIIKLKWYTKHTVVDSRRLVFVGTVGNLFVKHLVWTLLTGITFGIYGLFVPVKTLRWETENTIDHEHTPEALMKQSEYRTNVHTDATAFKTYAVENEMEGVKSGITNDMSADDLLKLANNGARSAQYEYVVRYADGQFTEEPFSSLLKSAAEAEYAPAMMLYATTHTLDAAVRKEMLKKAADKGQITAIKAYIPIIGAEALALEKNSFALTFLKEVVRYADLLIDSGEELSDEEQEVTKKCVLAIRKIESAQLAPSNKGKGVLIGCAAAGGVVLLITILIAVAAFIFGRSPMDSWSDPDNMASEYSYLYEDSFVSSVKNDLIDGGYDMTGATYGEDEYGSDTVKTYTVFRIEEGWESECTVSTTTDSEGYLVSVNIHGERATKDKYAGQTEQMIEAVTRSALEYLSYDYADELEFHSEKGYYTDTHQNWKVTFDNTSSSLDVRIVYDYDASDEMSETQAATKLF